ncbi:MAG: Formate dehydrogenase O putative subunit, partial [uncultured Blastococcus sp.]
GRRRRHHDDLHAGGRGRAVTEDGGRGRRDRARCDAQGGERPRPAERALPRGPSGAVHAGGEG